jgi:large subunit ribosomal protein L10
LSLNRNEKAAVIEGVAAQAARSQTLALAEYRGLTVENLNKLRVDARAKGVYLHVLKNTLARAPSPARRSRWPRVPWSVR